MNANTTPTTDSALIPCKRCRVGDYVQGDDSEGDHVVAKITKVAGDMLVVTTRLGSTHELLKYETFKASRAEYEAYGAANQDTTGDLPEPMLGNGLDLGNGHVSSGTEGTSSAPETAPGHVSPSKPVAQTKATPPPADGSCPLCGAESAQQTPNDHSPSNPRSNFCNSCNRAWSLKTGREVKVIDGPVRLHPKLDRYVKHPETTASGRRVMDIDDQVAAALRGLNLDDTYRQVVRYLAALGAKGTPAKPVTMDGLRAKYGHLNPGMQRMNLGNLLRGVTRRTGDNLPEVTFGEDPENPDA